MQPEPFHTDAPTDAFIRHVAHDLRASLNAIVGWAELVKAGHLAPDERTRAGETIVRHARHLSQRLGDALDLWRLDVGLLGVSTRPSSVATIVRAAIEAARPHCDGRRVDCQARVLSDGTARVDAPRLGQALVILLADAIANTPSGHRVDVTTSVDATDVVVRVTGAGRLPDANAFERQPSEERASGGSRPFDFALPLARTLVAFNGGALDAEPAEDGGVSFVLRLPRLVEVATGENDASRGRSLDGVRVLVVDDHQDARDVVEQLLKPFGAVVTSVPSMADALAVMHQKPVDVLVADLAMPGGDGYDLVRTMRRDTQLAGIPAAALSACTSDEDRRRAFNAGFQEFLPKPVQPAALVSTLAMLFRRARSHF